MADMERIVDAEEKSETEPGLHLLVFSGDSVSGYSWHRSGTFSTQAKGRQLTVMQGTAKGGMNDSGTR